MAHSRLRRHRRDQPVTPAAIAKYEAALDQVVNAGLPQRMPDVLFHYTTWQGFRGIASSQRMHARAHYCTNDPAELTSLDGILTEIATDLVRPVAPPLKRPLQSFKDLPQLRIGNVAKVYLACFSVAKDSASQWRRYADEGKGVCLGFKVLHDEKPPSSKVATLPVVYDEEVWRSAVSERFNRVVDGHNRFGRRHRSGYSAGEASAWSALMRIAALASISAKKPEWSTEEEWRSVVIRAEGDFTPLFKPDGSEYIELQLRKPPLLLRFDEILLGPRQVLGEVDAISEARVVLERAGYASSEMPPINVSDVDLS